MAKAKPSKGNHPPPPPPHRLASVFDDPPRQKVILLSCMDQRLLDETVVFMNDLNLHNRYDQIALAGGGLSSNFWPQVFLDHLKAAIDVLHRPIKDVFLFEHLDCGAYKTLHPDPKIQAEYAVADRAKMMAIHTVELRKFARVVGDFIDAQPSSPGAKAEDWEDIRISYFVMDLLGDVTQLDVPKGERSTITG